MFHIYSKKTKDQTTHPAGWDVTDQPGVPKQALVAGERGSRARRTNCHRGRHPRCPADPW